ncbi:MAG: hypothetical protein J0L74_12880 [Burkholderiales bacterium]|nr:hypothetical protein [Burkholderiales bacterium]
MTTPVIAPLPASPSAQQPIGARLARLWTYFREYRLGWVIAVLGSLISALTEASVPALLKPLLDEGFTQGSLPIWVVPLAIVGLFALRGFAHFASQYALARIANEGMVKLRRQLFDRLLAAELSLFARQNASQLANTLVYEVQTGTTLLVQALLNLARDSFSVVALMAYLLYLNWSLTLIVLVLVPIVALIMKTMSRRLYRYTRLSQATTDELAYVVEENVLAHRMVRLHGAQGQQAGRFDTLSRQLRGLSIKATSASAAAMPLAQMAAAVALSVVIGIALHQGQSDTGQRITVGGFVSFIGAMLMLIQPLRRLTDVVGPVTRGLAALERGRDRIGALYDRMLASGRLTAEDRALRLSGATFSAELADLAQVDLVIEAVFEDMAVKKGLLVRLEAVTRADVILATNTSYLDLNEMAGVLARPQNLVGLHFFSPAHVMKLLEIVRAKRTAPDVLASAVTLGRRFKEEIKPQDGGPLQFMK